MSTRRYCLDTSGFLDGYDRYYPPRIFSSLWDRMDALARSSRLIIPEEVYEELKVHHDDAFRWVEERKDELILPTDEKIIAEVQSVLEDYPRLVMAGSTRNRADPFVIGTASLTQALVVTGERGGTERSPKIPFVCDGKGIEHLDFLGLVQHEGWSF